MKSLFSVTFSDQADSLDDIFVQFSLSRRNYGYHDDLLELRESRSEEESP